MFIVNSYPLAVLFCFITMMCWGSWGNTQKLASKEWRYELFYWDYVIGMVLFSLLISFTMGSIGSEGRHFIDDLGQASLRNIGSVILGGVIFNASNILLSASTSIAGMAVAFPLGVGLSLVLGTIINYIGAPKGDPLILFMGVALIVVAVICNGVASSKVQREGADPHASRKGILLALLAGVGPCSRQADSLQRNLHLYRGCAGEQPAVQFTCHEVSVRGGKGLLQRIFQRQGENPSGGSARRCDMVPRYRIQLYRVR